MKFFRNFCITLGLLLIFDNCVFTEVLSQNALQCLIKNNKISPDYLFVSYEKEKTDTEDFNLRKVFAYSYKEAFNELNFRKIKWELVPIGLTNLANKGQTFYMRSEKFPNEYLCSSKHYASSLFGYRRKVYMKRLDMENDTTGNLIERKYCMWRFEKSDTDQNRFTIWNRASEEPLYKAKSFLRNIKKYVYTWHKGPDSDQFNWYVHCF